jgi:hypothetical protein
MVRNKRSIGPPTVQPRSCSTLPQLSTVQPIAAYGFRCAYVTAQINLTRLCGSRRRNSDPPWLWRASFMVGGAKAEGRNPRPSHHLRLSGVATRLRPRHGALSTAEHWRSFFMTPCLVSVTTVRLSPGAGVEPHRGWATRILGGSTQSLSAGCCLCFRLDCSDPDCWSGSYCREAGWCSRRGLWCCSRRHKRCPHRCSCRWCRSTLYRP